MDKMHRQKVAEVEKLTQTVHELEEAVLAGGAAANAVRDYQRKVQEMNVMTLNLGILSSSKRQLLVGWVLQIASNLQTCIGREKNFRTGGSSSEG